MKRRSTIPTIVVGAALSVVLAACSGGSSGGGGSSSGSGATPVYNAGVGKIANPSTTKGGTLRMAVSEFWDSLDPGDTYYAMGWNMARLYGRSLTMFKPGPGDEGTKLVPDLATSLGKPSDGGKTWTYTLKDGVKFEDGTAITSKDVKYAVSRSLDKSVLPDGYSYFNDWLVGAKNFSVYKGAGKGTGGLKSIETPDDKTIVFHLVKPFGGFDYFAMLPATVPVPQAKDTGAKYKLHVISSGPYMFKEYNEGKNFTLVRNPNWDAATDPNRPALPDEITAELGANADDIDSRLISGDLDVDIAGSGLQPAGQGRVLADPSLKENSDSASVARTWYTSINPDVAPLNNINCRKAIEFAADKTSYQSAYGGPPGGDIATGLLPPLIPGYKAFDLYEAKSQPNGDDAKAKAALAACGQPNGFSTVMTYRSDRPKEKAVSEALQQSLSKVGIKVTLKPFPTSDYFTLYAGKPSYAKANGLGLIVNGWGADWPDGFGFLSQIVDSRVIKPGGGNYNVSVKIPEVDKMIDETTSLTDVTKQQAMWGNIDERVMQDASVLPGVWAKGLLYRPPNVTNVFVNNGFQMYDYVSMGVKK